MEALEQAIGIGVLLRHPGRGLEVFLGQHAVDELRQIQRRKPRLHADCAPHPLQDFGLLAALRAGQRQQLERHRLAVGRQQFTGRLRVVSRPGGLAVIRGAFAQRALAGPANAVGHQFDESLAVHGQGQRAPHARVAERCAGMVQHHHLRAQPDVDACLQAGGARLLGLQGIDGLHQIDVASAQALQAGLLVGQRSEDDALQMGQARAPVGRIALDDDAVAARELHQFERTGAHRPDAVVGARGGDRRRRGDEGKAGPQNLRRKRGPATGQPEHHGVVGRRLDGRDRLHRRQAGAARVGIGQAFEVRSHGLGIERRAVMKAHPLAQCDRPAAAVRRALDAGGERAVVAAVALDVDQRVVHRVEDGLRAGIAAAAGRIERGRLGVQADVQRAAGLWCRGRGGRRRGGQGLRQGQRAKTRAQESLRAHGVCLLRPGCSGFQWLCRGCAAATPRYFSAGSMQAPLASWPTVAR